MSASMASKVSGSSRPAIFGRSGSVVSMPALARSAGSSSVPYVSRVTAGPKVSRTDRLKVTGSCLGGPSRR